MEENCTENTKECCTEETTCCETLAGKLYTTYCEGVGGVAFNGDMLPTWEEFRADDSKRKQSDAWVHVATNAINLCA